MSQVSSIDAENNAVGKYTKSWQSLSKTECLILSKFHLKLFDNSLTREQIVRLILLKDPDLIKTIETRRLAFEIYEKTPVDGTRRIKFVNIDQPDEIEYPIRSGHGARIKVDEIITNIALQDADDDLQLKDEFEIDQIPITVAAQVPAPTSILAPAPKATLMPHPNVRQEKFFTPFGKGEPTESPIFEEKVDPVNASIVTAIGRITNQLEEIQFRKSKPVITSKNLRYDDAEGVDSFLKMIEISSRGQKLYRDEDKVALAHQVLSQSAQGSKLLGLCTDADVSSWQKFSSRLMSMQGLSAKSYELKFLSATRKPGESAPMFMASLIDCYKRSQEYPDAQILNRFESKSVLMRFCQSLEPELRNLLQDRLTTAKMAGNEIIDLDKAATLCQQLETCFELGSNARTKVNAVSKGATASASENPQIINLLKEQLDHMRKLTSSKNNRRNSRDSKKGKKTGKHLGLKGYCMFYISNKGCNYDNCRYKHETAPADVMEHYSKHYAPILEKSQD